jgi:glutaredoxin 3
MSKKVLIYTMHHCPYCLSAKELFKKKKITFEEKLVAEDDDATWERLEKETGYKTMPQIFIGDQFIGGFSELSGLDREGKLDSLLK